MKYSITQERAKIYAFKAYFSPLQAGAIMLDIDPNLVNLNDRQDLSLSDVHLLSDVLSELAQNDKFKDVVIGEYSDFGRIETYIESISAEELKQWALSNGYQWLSSNNTVTNNDEFQSQLTAKDEEIARLKAEIENLSKLAIQKDETEQTKDNEFTPCYLNKFTKHDPLAIAIQIRNSEWKDYNPETDAKKSATQIKKKIKSNHKGISDTLAEMIEKVACPIDRTRNK